MKTDKRTILICSAMKEELLPLIRIYLPDLHKVKKAVIESVDIGDIRLLFFVAGVSKIALQKTLPKLDPYIQTIDEVWFIGVCGALASELSVGETVDFEYVQQQGVDSIALASHRETQKGNIVTADVFVAKAQKKTMKELLPSATCVDMEAYYVAKYCSTAQTPLRVIKTVSDSVTMNLPDEAFLQKHYRERARIRKIKIFFNHPIKMWQMMRLRRGIGKAIRNNTQFVREELEKL